MQENRSTEQNRIRAISLVLAVIIWRGTSIPVALAKDFMTADERVEMLAAAREGFAPRAREIGAGEGIICGRIRTEDGKELPEKVVLVSLSELNATTSYGLHPVSGCNFRAETCSGNVHLIAAARGYAPVIVGPLRLFPDQTIEDVTIVLPVGVDSSIRVEDTEGRPIEGAAVRGWPAMYGGVFLSTLSSLAGDDRDLIRAARMVDVPVTNDRGLAAATHLTDEPYRIEVRAGGFQTTEQRVLLSPERPTVIRLKKARPFVGQVSNPAGEPIAGAEVRLDGRNRFFVGLDFTFWNDRDDANRIIAKTDDSGRFVLNQLNDDFVYTLRIDSDQRGHAVVENVLAGEERKINVEPKSTVRGTIAGLPEECDQPRPNTITVFGREQKTGDKSACRRVIVTFAHFGWPVAPKGSIAIWGDFDGTPIDSFDVYPVSNGAVKLNIPTPGDFICKPGDIVGWYFDTAYPDVEPGKGPLKVTVPVRPAGAVMGRIILPPGFIRKGGGDSLSLDAQVELDDDRREGIEANMDSGFRYFATPIPLDARCALKMTYGHYVFVTPHFKLDHAEPLREIDLKLPEPVTARVRVTYPDGCAAANVPVTLHWERDGYDGGVWLFDEVWEIGNTDAEGRIDIPNLNPDCPQYQVGVPSRQTWQPTRANLRTDGKETHIHLKRGHELAVMVLDDKTGLPVPGEVVSARLHPAGETWLGRIDFEAEAHSDQDGKCRFSNLPEATVRLEVAGRHPPKEGDWDVDVAREKEIVIRAVNYPRFVVGHEGAGRGDLRDQY